MSSQKVTAVLFGTNFEILQKVLKQIKQIFKILLLLLVFITGSSSNLLFAKSTRYNDHCAKYLPIDNSPRSGPFIFQPIEDFQSEDDDHISIENDLFNFTIELLNFIDFDETPSIVLNESVIERRLWCINNNLRL